MVKGPQDPKYKAILGEHAEGVLDTLLDVFAERARQHEKFGLQHHLGDFRFRFSSYRVDEKLSPWGLVLPSAWERPRYYGVPSEAAAKAVCEGAFSANVGSWADVLIEEVSEALEADTQEHLREELVQVAAVCTAWCEAIDARAKP